MKKENEKLSFQLLKGKLFQETHSELKLSASNFNDSPISNNLLARQTVEILAFLKRTKEVWALLGREIFIMTREVLIILFKRERKKQKVAVEAPPGHYLMAIADFFFSKKKNVRVFIPLIADMREEYYAALIQHRQWKAMWIKIRGTWSFFATIGVDRAYSFLLLFVKTWKGVR